MCPTVRLSHSTPNIAHTYFQTILVIQSDQYPILHGVIWKTHLYCYHILRQIIEPCCHKRGIWIASYLPYSLLSLLIHHADTNKFPLKSILFSDHFYSITLLAIWNNPQIQLTSKGDAISLWESGMSLATRYTGTINSSIYSGLFPLPPLPIPPVPPTPPIPGPIPVPTPPPNPSPIRPKPITYLKGKIIKERYKRKMSRVYKLTWVASPDLSVKSYRIYRNFQLIKRKSGLGHHSHFFRKKFGIGHFFTSKNRYPLKKQRAVYTVTSVNAYGIESEPLKVTLK
jgi:hypothetical protein